LHISLQYLPVYAYHGTEYSSVRSCLEAGSTLAPECSCVFPQTLPAALLKPFQNTTGYVDPDVEILTNRDYIYYSFIRHLYATTTTRYYYYSLLLLLLLTAAVYTCFIKKQFLALRYNLFKYPCLYFASAKCLMNNVYLILTQNSWEAAPK